MELNLTSLDVLERRVGRGAQLLDLHRPGWAREIDVEKIEVDCPVHSITGQLFGPDISDQMTAVGIRGGDTTPWGECDAFAEAGFCILRADIFEIPESIQARMRAIGEELSALVGRDITEVVNAPTMLPVPRDPDVVTQEAFTIEHLWGKAVKSRL